MKLEQQVCSLELAKRLKELGCKQESFFGWFEHDKPFLVYDEDRDSADCSAYTVAELGEMLPYSIDCRATGDGRCYRQLSITENGIHQACYTNYTKDVGLQEADTEADARAKMIVYLLENGLITQE